jgi:hypothetical protein
MLHPAEESGMDSTNLFVVSTIAYIVAFAILAALAIMMRIITSLFPERESSSDAAVVAAVSATYQVLSPGVTVTKIEESK